MAKAHTHLIASDVPASVDFYVNVLGAEFMRTGTDAEDRVVHGEVNLYGERVIFSADRGRPNSDHLPWRVRGVQSQGPRGAGFALRIGLEQGEDLDEFYGRVKDAGGPILLAPEEQSWGARLFCVEAPDGYVVFVEKFPDR